MNWYSIGLAGLSGGLAALIASLIFGKTTEKKTGYIIVMVVLFFAFNTFSKFESLNDDDALAYFASWESGFSFQLAVSKLLKVLTYISYWQDSSTWKAIEFPGPVTEKWGLKPLGVSQFQEEG